MARLRADEQNLERRRHNVTNFGSAWLKPPGIPKTLYQLREERREAEEHQEAMRREQLAQDLAEAEAAGGGTTGMEGPETQDQNGDPTADGMDDVQLDGARDLDEDIPEGDSAGFGLDSDEEEEDDDEDEQDENTEGVSITERAMEARLLAQRMRENNSFQGASFYDGEEDLDEEARAGMIEEDDLVGDGDIDDMGMGGDLDDDIPEGMSGGLSGGYEHTDSEEGMSSGEADEDAGNTSYVPPSRAPQAGRFRNSLARSDVTRHSLAISDLLSRDGSSVLGSSPQMPRPPGYGNR